MERNQEAALSVGWVIAVARWSSYRPTCLPVVYNPLGGSDATPLVHSCPGCRSPPLPRWRRRMNWRLRLCPQSVSVAAKE